jgi:anthranilate synthase component 1
VLDTIAPIALYDKLRVFFDGKRILLFESGEHGSFSYVFVDVRERVWHEQGKSFHIEGGNLSYIDENPLNYLKRRFRLLDQISYKQIADDLGVGFIDGFVGFVGYEAVRLFEPVLARSMSDLADVTKTPDLDLIRPKYVFVYSHKNYTLTALSTLENSQSLLEEAVAFVQTPQQHIPLIKADQLEEGSFKLSKKDFMDKIEEVKEQIVNGEIFQMLLANRYIQPSKVDPFSYYRVLRSKNPSPYQFFLPYERFSIVGCSPELMVGLHSNQIELSPIAGTRKRGGTIARDLELERELLNDEKERAEHIMLVDLGRNDVGRVAKIGSVRVENLMHIERFSHVMHIVSDIIAELENDKDMFDLFMSAFSAGTMTGAPKIRAMELIAAFEGTRRGFYSGAVALFGFTGDMDSAITIRSAQIDENRLILHAGVGVVADSKPELEWLELQNKLGAMKVSYEDLLKL